MIVALGAMGGHMGKSGHATGSAYHANCGNAGPVLVKAGSATMPKTKNPCSTGVRQPQLYELIKNGGGDVLDVLQRVRQTSTRAFLPRLVPSRASSTPPTQRFRRRSIRRKASRPIAQSTSCLLARSS